MDDLQPTRDAMRGPISTSADTAAVTALKADELIAAAMVQDGEPVRL